MSAFYPLKVKEIRDETEDCKSVVFEIPAELRESFAFMPGQYLTLKTTIQGEEIRRSYSLCAAPYENEWRVAVKKVKNGKFSGYVNQELKKGDILEVMRPEGHFTPKNYQESKKHYLLIAAGSGITPILSIAKSILKESKESRISLVYGNKNSGSIIFHEEIEAIKNKYLGRCSVQYILSKERLEEQILHGRIDAKKLEFMFKQWIPIQTIDDIFVCGPEEMIHAVREQAIAQGFDEKNIHFELFNSQSIVDPSLMQQLQEEAGKNCKVTVTVDGKSFDFDLAFGQNNILDAALQEGADLPYACKGGVCCTCKAKLVQGEVTMLKTYGLMKDEIENGYILSCQAYPKSEELVVNFDDF